MRATTDVKTVPTVQSRRRSDSGTVTTTWLVTVPVVLIGVGNLVLTENAQARLPIDYLLLSLALCALIALYRLRAVGRRAAALAPLALFLGGCVVGYVTSAGSSYAQNKYLTFAIVCIVAAALSTVRVQERLHRSLALSLAVVGSVSSVLLLTLGAVTATGRFTLFDLNPISLARATGLIVVVALALVITSKPSRRRPVVTAALLILAILGAVATVVTGSRGPLLSVSLALVCVLAVTLRTRKLGAATVVLLFVFSGIAYSAVTVFGGAGLDRLESGIDSGRNTLYAQTWEVIKDQPIVGIGWGNFPLYIFDFASDDGTLYPHNILLEIWVEGGLLPLVGFVVLTMVAVRRAYQAAVTSRWSIIIFGLLIYALANALVSSDVVGNRLMWVLLTLALLARPDGPAREHASMLPDPERKARFIR